MVSIQVLRNALPTRGCPMAHWVISPVRELVVASRHHSTVSMDSYVSSCLLGLSLRWGTTCSLMMVLVLMMRQLRGGRL